MEILIVILTTITMTKSYHRSWGPVIGPFAPGPVRIVNECEEKDGNVCLELPTLKICEEKLKQYINPWFLPWWVFYCQILVEEKYKKMQNNVEKCKTTPRTTLHPRYRETLEALKEFKKKGKETKLECFHM